MPERFGPDDETCAWFTQHVREQVIEELSKLLKLPLDKWPTCSEIFMRATEHAKLLLAWLKDNEVTGTSALPFPRTEPTMQWWLIHALNGWTSQSPLTTNISNILLSRTCLM